MPFTMEKYVRTLENALISNTELLTENLRTIKNFNFFKEIDLLDFGIHIQLSELSIMMYSMEKDANEVFYEGHDESIFSGSYEALEEIEFMPVPEDDLEAFDAFVEENDENIYDLQEKIIVEWFVSCWNKAVGHLVELPTFVGIEDGIKSYDLQKDGWILSEDKWED